VNRRRRAPRFSIGAHERAIPRALRDAPHGPVPRRPVAPPRRAARATPRGRHDRQPGERPPHRRARTPGPPSTRNQGRCSVRGRGSAQRAATVVQTIGKVPESLLHRSRDERAGQRDDRQLRLSDDDKARRQVRGQARQARVIPMYDDAERTLVTGVRSPEWPRHRSRGPPPPWLAVRTSDYRRARLDAARLPRRDTGFADPPESTDHPPPPDSGTRLARALPVESAMDNPPAAGRYKGRVA
jgi:hypothetical protein